MTNLQRSLVWAAAILALAIGVSVGAVDRDAAEPFFYIFPVLAIITLRGQRDCLAPNRGRS